MNLIKLIRTKRIAKAREKIEKKLEKEQDEVKEENKKINYKENLKRLKEKAPGYVLTISAPAYVKSVGKELTDYEFRCIRVKGGQRGYNTYWGALEVMAEKGEEINAEIIVASRPSEDNYRSYLLATALIPKNLQNKQKKEKS